MRNRIVAGNWKMNNTLEEGVSLTSEIVNMVADELKDDVKMIICAPFIHLSSVSKIIGKSEKVFLGAQNCNDNLKGAFTGEISVGMLKSVGVEYVILGHSERREYYGESNAFLAKKVNTVLEAGLTPIFCCGETLEIRERNEHFKFVTNQLTESLFHLSVEDIKKIVIAYEPIWAIGTGVTASKEQAQEMHEKLRAHLAAKYGQDVAEGISILYGGSCNPKNANELFAQKDIDGGLIGGASLKSRDFVDIGKSY
ncbi:MAG: triose-phosphate isomerase [Cyclobacteriaceae bacterium]|nr:triose-phosphate isomerase [Cyclobacteriaceae bacterium]